MQSITFEKERVLPIVAVTTVLLYTSYKLIEVFTSKKLVSKVIPTPKHGLPIVGHMFSLGEFPVETVDKWHAELGPIFKLHMGVQVWILVADPNLAHKILISNGAKSGFRPDSHFAFNIHSKGGRGIGFSQPNEKWKRTRAELQAVLSPKNIEIYFDNINLEVDVLVNMLINETETKGGIFPFQNLKMSSMNIVFLLCFGRRFESAKDPEFETFSEIVEQSIKNLATESDIGNFLPWLSWLNFFNGTRSKYTQFFESVRDPLFIKNIHAAFDSDKPNVLKSIKENVADLTDEDYIAFLTDFLVAGTDTVAVSLLWNATIMCHNPKYQKKASNEVDEFIRKNGRLPYFSERTEVPFIISIIKECLRLKPTTQFGLPHLTKEQIEVDGYIIPKGAAIRTCMHTIHRSSKYDQPDLFKPERFMSNLKTMFSLQNSGWEERDQFNFGWGRRSCPGSYLAEAEIFSAFVRILAQCTIEPPIDGLPDFNKSINAGIHSLPVPCKMRFIKRPDSLLNTVSCVSS